MSDAQDWDHWLDEILDKGVNLSAWEEDFIDALQARRGSGLFPGRPGALHLTEKQADILERIFAARTP